MSENEYSVFDPYLQKLLSWWGVLFRFAFIACIGIGGWFYFDQPGMEDVPIGQLTLKQIGGRLAAVVISLGALGWFFSFPSKDEGLSYAQWGKFGAWLVFGAFCITAIVQKW
jgi:hypothetical protein